MCCTARTAATLTTRRDDRQTLELALLLPREAECRGCVDEVGRELARLEGVNGVAADVPRGLLTVSFDESLLTGDDLRIFARRAGAQAHCLDHCPLAVHDHGQLDLLTPLPGEDGAEHRVLHVTGMDCADCALKLQSALRRERGVSSAQVNFGAATLAVSYDSATTGLPSVFKAVQRLGYDTVERRALAAAAAADARPTPRQTLARRRRRLAAHPPRYSNGDRRGVRGRRLRGARRWRRPPRRGSSPRRWSRAGPSWPAPPSSACARARST